MSNKLRDALRAATIGKAVECKKKEFEYEGSTVVFHQPSNKVRQDIINRSASGDKLNTVSFSVWVVIYLTYDVDGVRVFEDADYDSFMALPSGSFIDVFAAEAMKLLGNGEAEGSLEA